MAKKWIKHYLFLGTILMVIVALVSSLALISTNLRKTQEKHEFMSMYEDTSIDFIVPSPSYDQVYEEENNSSNGIGVMTPYFSTTTDVLIAGNRMNTEVLMFPNVEKIEQTPYCSSRIIDGDPELSAGDAVVDQDFIERHGVAIGDSVKISIRDTEICFTITCISENNLLEDEGSIAVILDADTVQMFMADNMTYTAAYVEADDYGVCKDYLISMYKPYGRLKPASDFSSEDVYNNHVEDFLNADWSKEITNFADNYDSLKVKYANYDSACMVNRVISAVLAGLAIFVYQVVLLGNQSLKKFMRNYLVKKNGSVTKVANFFSSGVLYMTCLFMVVMVVLYYISATKISRTILISGVWNGLIPVLVAVAASIIMVLVSGITVKTRYSSKKIQAWKEAERKRLDGQNSAQNAAMQ